MTNTNITTSNGINLTIDDLKEAIELANVNWNEAAYANGNAGSKDPIDICIFDFFDMDAWDIVDADFTEEYGDYDEDKILALKNIIERRSSVWQDWAEQIRLSEEDLYALTGKPFSLDYAQLYLACEHEAEYNLDFKDTIFSMANSSNYIGYKVENGYTNYNYNFVWGNVNYTVTLMYEGNLIDSQEFRDGQPDCISIKVAQE